MENKVFLINAGSHSLRLFNDKEAVKEFLKNDLESTLDRYKVTYRTRPEVIQDYLSHYAKAIRIIEADKCAIFDFGFYLSDIAAYGSKFYKYDAVTREYTLSHRERVVSEWNYPNKGLLEKAKEENALFNEVIKKHTNDITEEFLVYDVEEVVLRKTIKAKVTKKSLKSFGKEVEVVDKRFQDTDELEGLRNSLERVTVNVPGWGTITMSPDSLGEFEVKPVTKEIKMYKVI